ncbi:MAG TPA: metallophosphoesterase [Candidatus Saccharimonadales bacterium]|nr:metallophosphoesterase [Candidatus Saccharimonadales bacterium]
MNFLARNGARYLAGFGWVFLACALQGWAHTAPAERAIRIALLSDTHVNRNGTNDGQDLYRGPFERAIGMVNTSKVDLVLFTGDLTQDGKPEQIKDFLSQIQKLSAPVFYVPGNHDVGNKIIPGKGGTVTEARVVQFEKELGPSFFSKTAAGVRVIGINSPLLGSGFEREKVMWNFLEKELSQPRREPTIVFSHYPVFLKTPDEGGGDYWNMEPEPRKRLLDLLKKGEVKTMLSGHLHRDLVNRWEGILFVSTRPISFGLPKGKQPQGWTLVTLPPNGEAQYELIEIQD